ncbi:MAG: hypothetical protein WCJ66_16390 [Verrucomicrobiota bacterium]
MTAMPKGMLCGEIAFRTAGISVSSHLRPFTRRYLDMATFEGYGDTDPFFKPPAY